MGFRLFWDVQQGLGTVLVDAVARELRQVSDCGTDCVTRFEVAAYSIWPGLCVRPPHNTKGTTRYNKYLQHVEVIVRPPLMGAQPLAQNAGKRLSASVRDLILGLQGRWRRADE